MVNTVVAAVLVVLMAASFFFYWQFKVLDKRQMIFAIFSTLILFFITGAWTVLLNIPNAPSIVILTPLFYFLWYFLTKLTANLIHRDDHSVVHFL